MHVEDLLEKLAEYDYSLGAKDRKLIRSLARRSKQKQPLTSRQGWALLNILRINDLYVDVGMKKEAYIDFLKKPDWRIPLVPSVDIKSEVRYIGDHMLGFRTSFASKMDTDLVNLRAKYIKGMNVVCVENRAFLNSAINFIGTYGFQMDEDTEQYLAEALQNSKREIGVSSYDDQIVFDVPNDNTMASYFFHVIGADIL